MTFDPNIIKFSCLANHLKEHPIRFKWPELYIVIMIKTTLMINYVMMGTLKFDKKLNFLMAVMQKPYNV